MNNFALIVTVFFPNLVYKMKYASLVKKYKTVEQIPSEELEAIGHYFDVDKYGDKVVTLAKEIRAVCKFYQLNYLLTKVSLEFSNYLHNSCKDKSKSEDIETLLNSKDMRRAIRLLLIKYGDL